MNIIISRLCLLDRFFIIAHDHQSASVEAENLGFSEIQKFLRCCPGCGLYDGAFDRGIQDLSFLSYILLRGKTNE